jgi:type I restriction enzyme S subunit
MSKRLSPDDLLDYEFEELEDKDALSQKLWAAYRVKESYRKLLAVTDDMLKAEFLKMFGDGVANPNNWPEVTLSECFPYIKNGVNIKQISGASGIPITRIETLSGSVFNRDRLGYANIHDIAKYEKYVLSTGDLLMSHINSKAYIGRTVEYIKNGEEIIIHGMNLLCLKVDKQKLLPSFYVHYTHSRKYIEDIARIRKDAINQSSINTTDFGNLKIILPPLELQQQFIEIANQAEIAKSSLRKSIESINRVMHNLINQ